MRIAFIGDIVGRVGRNMVKLHLPKIVKKYNIDIVIANYENASGGFGLTPANAKELFESGISVMTGGNHSFDKKELIPLIEENDNILRPLNFSKKAPGKGIKIVTIKGEKLAILNLMGSVFMPMSDNPFVIAEEKIEELQREGIKNIFIDFHAETTSEKRGLFELFKGKVGAICGTHTHIGTDDLIIENGTLYLSDIGKTGCRGIILGMDSKNVYKQFIQGIKVSFSVPKECKKIMQVLIFDIENGKTTDGFKIKIYDEKEDFISQKAFKEN